MKVVEVCRVQLNPQKAPTFAEWRTCFARLLEQVPEQYRGIATVRVDAELQHLYGETEAIDMDDVHCFPALVVEYTVPA